MDTVLRTYCTIPRGRGAFAVAVDARSGMELFPVTYRKIKSKPRSVKSRLNRNNQIKLDKITQMYKIDER